MLSTSLLLFTAIAVVPCQQAPTAVERVEGRVVDMRGEPVPAARVAVALWSEPERELATTSADAEGCFVLGKVPVCAAWAIRATAPGRAHARVLAAPGDGPITVQLPEGVRVKGRVVDGKGQPVPSATVAAALAFARELKHARDLAVTDKDGRFEMTRVPLGIVWFTAAVPGESMAAARRHVTADCEIEVAPASWPTMDASIEVRGLPEGGIPAACAVIEAQMVIGLPPPWDRMAFDGSGRCELKGMPGFLCTVTPEIPGYFCRPRSAQLSAAQTNLTFEAAKVEQVAMDWSGTLQDQGGKPLGGVGLELTVRAGPRHQGYPAGWELTVPPGPRFTAMTSADGRWRFALPVAAGTGVSVRLVSSDWVLDAAPRSARHAQEEASWLWTFTGNVEQGGQVDLRVLRACSVTGRVLLADGATAALVGVTLMERHLRRVPEWKPMLRTATDLQGRYRFRGVHAIDRQVRVAVDGERGLGETEPFALNDDGMQSECPDLRLRSPGIVEGCVVGADGKPVVGMRVWLTDARSKETGRYTEVFTDRAGRFRMAGVPPGAASISVGSEGSRPTSVMHEVEVAASATSRCRLTCDGK